MYVILGIKQKKGVYEGNSYDNKYIGCSDSDSKISSLIAGADVDVQKVKSSVWDSCLKELGLSDSDTIGMGITYTYDKWQNVVGIELYNMRGGE